MISYQVEMGHVGVSHSNFPQTATKPLILLQTTYEGDEARIAMTVDETIRLIKRLEENIKWAKKLEKKSRKLR